MDARGEEPPDERGESSGAGSPQTRFAGVLRRAERRRHPGGVVEPSDVRGDAIGADHALNLAVRGWPPPRGYCASAGTGMLAYGAQ